MRTTRGRIFRLVVALAAGALGFGLNLVDFDLIRRDGFQLQLLAGLFFPLLIAMAWGWKYGLLAALAGGWQSVCWLLPETGWGMFYPATVFTLWIVWHGWWAEFRNGERRWTESCFVVEIPFRVVAEIGFLTVFPWLLTFNPPPWRPAGTPTEASPLWLQTTAIKHVIEAYLLLLGAYVALGLGPVRRFFGLHDVPAQRATTTILAGAVFFILGILLADFLLRQSAPFDGERNLLDFAVLGLGGGEIALRLFVVAVVVGAAAALAKFNQQGVRLRESLEHKNRILAAIRNVNQLITREKDEKTLIEAACKMLSETRGFHQVWIAVFENPPSTDEIGTANRPAIAEIYRAGFDAAFDQIENKLRDGKFPQCGLMAVQAGGVHVIQNPSTECHECPLHVQHGNWSSMVTRLESNGRVFGWLCASVPCGYAASSEEQGLFEEVAGDLAYALRSIRMEVILKRQELAYRQLFETMQEGFALHEIILDDAGVPVDYRFLSINPAFERITGLSASELLGRTLLEVFPAAEPLWIERYGKVATSGNPVQFEEFSGALQRDFSVSAFRPQPGQFAVIFTDVTERNQKEQALRDAMQAAEAANRAKTEFLATMSHELRTPLTPIMGLSELMAMDDNLTAEQKEFLGIVHRRSQDLLELINDLLNLSTIESGRFTLRPEQIDLAGLLNDAIANFQQEADTKGLRLDSEIASGVPQEIRADPSRLRQILLNLIGNAVKFTECGGIKTRVELAQDQDLAEAAPDSVVLRFAVHDSGPGIPEAEQSTIFEPFKQADTSPTRKHGGAGLGLAICRRLVGLMGGEISVRSGPGEGSTFDFTIPVNTAKPLTPQPVAEPEPATGETRALRVLLAEDDATSALVARSLLESLQCQVTHVSDGRLAVAACRQADFDVVLLDIKMPVLDGLAAAREIRRSGVRVPVIAMTACAFEEDRAASIDAGMNDWITKPVDYAELKKMVAAVRTAQPRESGSA